MRNLTVSIIEKYIIKLYGKYQQIYGNDYVVDSLQHMREDPRDTNIPRKAKA